MYIPSTTTLHTYFHSAFSCCRFPHSFIIPRVLLFHFILVGGSAVLFVPILISVLHFIGGLIIHLTFRRRRMDVHSLWDPRLVGNPQQNASLWDPRLVGNPQQNASLWDPRHILIGYKTLPQSMPKEEFNPFSNPCPIVLGFNWSLQMQFVALLESIRRGLKFKVFGPFKTVDRVRIRVISRQTGSTAIVMVQQAWALALLKI